MTTRSGARPTGAGRRLRRTFGTGVLAAGLLLGVGSLGGTPLTTCAALMSARDDTTPPGDGTGTDPASDYQAITFVQANISKDEGQEKFDTDVASVFAQQPDIITFNEVYARSAESLAPEGYEMFRTPGPRTGWAPVVWKTSAWSAVATGTWQISGNPPDYRGKKRLLGVRYANWATLINPAGQIVSVISAHVAPNNKDTAELLVPSLKRLRTLAEQLRAQGPVLIGGDFNMGYHSDRYQPQYLRAAGLESSYDVLGTSFPTHKRGGTIDYVWLGPTTDFYINEQFPVLMKSDHRMVVSHMQLLSQAQGDPPPFFAAGKTVSVPRGTAAERRAVRNLQIKAIGSAPTGSAIHIASSRIRGQGLFDALTAAFQRGVNVTVVTGETPEVEGAGAAPLRTLLGSDSAASSYYVSAPEAWAATSSTGTSASGLTPTLLLVSRAGGTPAFALRADSDLGRASLRKSYPTPTTAKVSTTSTKYDELYTAYLAAIGRTY